ncbi:MAG: hypothetical protein S4CHLAM2_13290 [Chlamydiales bacterium]|nr:hypothetical protein [Chlamydiales bacterium]
MPRKKKIFIILHLIFTFTFFSWLLMKPYVLEVMAKKSQLALYEMVIEKESLFRSLPTEEQKQITEGFENARTRSGPSLMHAVGRLFFVDTSVFALAWIFFSIAICLLLLFHIEGATLAIWILPLLVVGYGYDLYASRAEKPEGLFPKEAYVHEHYIDSQEALSKRELLQKGWHRYLITEWAHTEPSSDPEAFQKQLDRGLFAFNIARLNWIQEGKGDEIVLAGFAAPPSFFRVLSYFLWNTLFAWMITRHKKVSRSAPLSNLS